MTYPVFLMHGLTAVGAAAAWKPETSLSLSPLPCSPESVFKLLLLDFSSSGLPTDTCTQDSQY